MSIVCFVYGNMAGAKRASRESKEKMKKASRMYPRRRVRRRTKCKDTVRVETKYFFYSLWTQCQKLSNHQTEFCRIVQLLFLLFFCCGALGPDLVPVK